MLLANAAAAQDAAPKGAPNAARNVSTPASLAALEQSVTQRTAQWDTLARNLDASILRLLPCDPKAAAAIAEVSKASDARVAAVAAYLEAAGRQAALQTAAARRVLASVQPLAGDLAAEKSDLAQEELGVAGQIAILTDSSQRRPSFNAAQDTLRQIAALEQQRSEAVDSAIGHDDAAGLGVRGLLAQLETGEAALKDIQAAFAAEGSRWSAYYAARLTRAQAECAAARGVVATPARPQPQAQPQGKQK